MIKAIKYTVITLATTLLIACGGGGSSVETSPEMDEFIKVVSTTKSIKKAANKFGYSEAKIPLYAYDLKEPLVMEKKANDCYVVSFKHGAAASKVDVCWKDKKITSITSLGFHMDR